jgi:K+ transporter
VFGASHAGTSKASEFRDWVGEDDLPIAQTTSLSRTPLTASVRIFPIPRGQRVGEHAWVPASFSPYFGVGGGAVLYTLEQTLSYLPPVARTDGILGSLSLMFWSLTFSVCFKYLGFITRADNHGEGGIFALLALSHHDGAAPSRRLGAFTLLILFGAALLYGDGVITPAISVLGAVEGLLTLHEGFTPYVPSIAAVILLILFSVQHRGSMALGQSTLSW